MNYGFVCWVVLCVSFSYLILMFRLCVGLQVYGALVTCFFSSRSLPWNTNFVSIGVYSRLYIAILDVHSEFFLPCEEGMVPVHFLCVHPHSRKLWDTIKKNTETLTDASKKVGLEVNAEKTKYMLLSLHQNAEKNHNIKIGDRSFENMAQFK
jgi:hypothetical protein